MVGKAELPAPSAAAPRSAQPYLPSTGKPRKPALEMPPVLIRVGLSGLVPLRQDLGNIGWGPCYPMLPCLLARTPGHPRTSALR
jgi:hypothetical protein